MKVARLIKTYAVDGVVINVYRADKGDGLPWHNHDYAHTCDVRAGRCLCETEDGRSVEIGPDDQAVAFRPVVRHQITALIDGTEFQNTFRS